MPQDIYTKAIILKRPNTTAPIDINSTNWVIVAISEHIEAYESLPGAGITVRVDKPTDFRVIITALEIVESGFGVVVIASIAQKESYAFVKPSLHHSKSPSLRRMLYGSISKSAFLAEALFL